MGRYATDEQIIETKNNIDAICSLLGITPTELGKKLGMVKAGIIQNIVDGKTRPSTKTIEAIRSVALDPSKLLGEAPKSQANGRIAVSGTTQELLARALDYTRRAIRVLEEAEHGARGILRPGIRTTREKFEKLAVDLEPETF